MLNQSMVHLKMFLDNFFTDTKSLLIIMMHQEIEGDFGNYKTTLPYDRRNVEWFEYAF